MHKIMIMKNDTTKQEFFMSDPSKKGRKKNPTWHF